MIDPCLDSSAITHGRVQLCSFYSSFIAYSKRNSYSRHGWCSFPLFRSKYWHFLQYQFLFYKKEKNRHLNLFTSKQLNLLMRKNPAIETKLLASTNRIYEKHLQWGTLYVRCSFIKKKTHPDVFHVLCLCIKMGWFLFNGRTSAMAGIIW